MSAAQIELAAARGDALDRARLRALSDAAAALDAAALLLSDPASVRWLGVRGGDGVHVLVTAGDALLVAAPGAEPDADALMVRGDDGSPAAQAGALAHALVHAGIGPDEPVAVEPAALAFGTAQGLGERLHRDASPAIGRLRAVKDADELDRIRAAAALSDAGHAALRDALAADVTELELWLAVQAAMARAAGAPVPAEVDLMAGLRTALIGAPPTLRAAAPGDAVLLDLAPAHDGYHADSCVTLACEPAPAALRRRHDVVRRALDRGLNAARPGVTAGEVDAVIRDELAAAGLECPHHTGHGVGAAAQEGPWLVPGADDVLEAGMVLALEPGAYGGGFGVRLEHLAVVAPDGARPLTSHPLDLT